MKKIKHSKEWYYNARLIAYWVGMAFCVVPTLIAGILKLPVIVVKDASPNAAVICWVLFGLMALVNSMEKSTIEGLTVVFAFAAVGNTLGAVCFKLSKEFEELWRHCGQVEVVNERLRGEK